MRRHLATLAWIAMAGCAAGWAAGCGAGSRGATNAVRDVPANSLEGIAPRYQPSFKAVGAAVQAHDDATARRVLDNLLGRIEMDRQLGGGEVGSVRATGDARALAEAFGRILDGRERVAAARLELSPALRFRRPREQLDSQWCGGTRNR